MQSLLPQSTQWAVSLYRHEELGLVQVGADQVSVSAQHDLGIGTAVGAVRGARPGPADGEDVVPEHVVGRRPLSSSSGSWRRQRSARAW